MLCDKIRNHPHRTSADANHFDDFAIVISWGEIMPVKLSSELRNTRVRVALSPALCFAGATCAINSAFRTCRFHLFDNVTSQDLAGRRRGVYW